MKLNVLRVLAVGIVVGGIALAMNTEKAEAAEWSPRSVEAIKADIAKAKDNQYTIVWGDTLSGISQATNLTVQKLADLNKIANVDLIYAGNTLVFDGNVVTAKNDKGETVAQSVVTPQDKNDANKPVGKQAPAKQEEKVLGTTASSQSQNKQGTPATSGKADTNKQGTSAAVGEYGQLEGFYSKEYVENGWKYVEAGPFKTGKDFLNWFDATYPGKGGPGYFILSGEQDFTIGDNVNLVAKKAIEYVCDSGNTTTENAETPAQPSEPVTPSQPTDNQSTQPSKPAEKPSTSTQPSTPTQPSTGGEQGGSTTPTTPDTTPINMGNSGKVFDSEEAASEYGYAEIANEKSPWYGYRFGASQLVNKDYELLGTWTVDFTENKPFDWNE
ncbi:LysM peptidoglycan-binding domain-containing protein [Enterococcus faecium]|uniref:LysM peptidoglycan-binding domain-containing protein n=1 Tax=Enterococcus faecium TaxID=1352 RepID=UPI000A189E0D|nr:LysM peptidoglycan-binding domain-containing protein [Enterococcus faecium]SMJ20371.1 LysM domain [Enterococcus faecium]SMJ23415.1 LysM domain [Enterococcus faecium]SMJ29270.1 LysM domain [Enterococcus faecium]SMJ29853.1 LysM domain [Enterococcus faecium]SMJ58568.1 LysM domain [Enterococcus faecium]